MKKIGEKAKIASLELANFDIKKRNSVLLGERISKERLEEIRSVAKRVADFYDSPCLRFKSYIDRVTACIIEYEYRL